MKQAETFKTPILFVIYDRSDTARQVFNVIKQVKPENLFISSDGPANRYKEESENVLNLRKEILEGINWKCNVRTRFGGHNTGPRNWISSSITWFFENAEEGIVLEHDCLPGTSFFYYCENLLQRYKSNPRIMHISGSSFVFGKKEFRKSYFFSKYCNIWGWASWKRAWEKYDIAMTGWEQFRNENKLDNILETNIERDYWRHIFDRAKKGLFNTWDYQWFYNVWNNNGISICPAANLVSNIGFGKGAVNTNYSNTVVSNLERHEIKKIKHPYRIKIDEEADRISFDYYYGEHLNNLFEQNEELHKTCGERLKLINELTKVSQERLQLIETLDTEIKRLKGQN